MKRVLPAAAVVLAAAGVLWFQARPDPGEFPPPVAGPEPAEIPLEAAGPAPHGPPRPLTREVPVPERLQNPRALDPKPLRLDFSAPPFERRKDGRISKTDVMASAKELHGEQHEPIEDLQLLQSLVGAYRQIFHENPIAGENHEVVAALTGRNLYRLVFIDPGHPAINARGELTDRWGTPYRFHPISGSHMEFSSAGRDGRFGSHDDIRLEPPGLAGARGLRRGEVSVPEL